VCGCCHSFTCLLDYSMSCISTGYKSTESCWSVCFLCNCVEVPAANYSRGHVLREHSWSPLDIGICQQTCHEWGGTFHAIQMTRHFFSYMLLAYYMISYCVRGSSGSRKRYIDPLQWVWLCL
jgi:hypothetical protein